MGFRSAGNSPPLFPLPLHNESLAHPRPQSAGPSRRLNLSPLFFSFSPSFWGCTRKRLCVFTEFVTRYRRIFHQLLPPSFPFFFSFCHGRPPLFCIVPIRLQARHLASFPFFFPFPSPWSFLSAFGPFLLRRNSTRLPPPLLCPAFHPLQLI